MIPKKSGKIPNLLCLAIVILVLALTGATLSFGNGIINTTAPSLTNPLRTSYSSSNFSNEKLLQRQNQDQQEHCDWLPRCVDSGFWFSDIHADPQPKFTLLSAWMKPEYSSAMTAARDIPQMYEDGFTMGGKVILKHAYYNNAYLGGEAQTPLWTNKLIAQNMEKAKNRQMMKYGGDGLKIHGAMERYINHIAGKKGIVVGSKDPWVEAILLHHGAGKLLTVEFGKITSEHPQVETMLAAQFIESFLNGKIEPFDFGISYSSLEHDGLGSYGDILNPIGDLQSMAKMTSVIKPGGLFFLGVPTGAQDILEFNAHRIYGPVRLPKLVAGWKLIDIIHNNEFGRFSQHVIVIQNQNGCNNIE